jgi:superfamily I DNA/RNA helicase
MPLHTYMSTSQETELEAVIQSILTSASRKKLIVAGPGAGKTTLFKRLLLKSTASLRENIVLTFINTLKADLEKDLAKLSSVFTFHGYCHSLLKRIEAARRSLTSDFLYFPALPKLVATDWVFTHGGQVPHFIQHMRELNRGTYTTFYMQRSDYYNAISFDDSVFRVYERLCDDDSLITSYELVLIDEFQDFNELEAAFIQKLASRSPIVIAGDDDQALYAQLRGASSRFIRELYSGTDYDNFELPFCMRCPEVIVDATNDIITAASRRGMLSGRIAKRYKHFPPAKGADSKLYPFIHVADCSVQKNFVNYFGHYIEQRLALIPASEIKESWEKGFPTALVIGPQQYLRQVADHLEQADIPFEAKTDREEIEVDRTSGLQLLKENHESRMGWRIVIETDQPDWMKDVITQSVNEETALETLIPDEFRRNILAEADTIQPATETTPPTAMPDENRPRIKLTSFEGSKGLSAQRVFILGLQEGEIPKNLNAATDAEICRLLVALTRTRKECHILYTLRHGAKQSRPSQFIYWIQSSRKRVHKINKDYWTSSGKT